MTTAALLIASIEATLEEAGIPGHMITSGAGDSRVMAPAS